MPYTLGWSRGGPHTPPRTSADAREWIERVTVLERELGRIESRLQITEAAESTLRDQLERERLRVDEERDRATVWKRSYGRRGGPGSVGCSGSNGVSGS